MLKRASAEGDLYEGEDDLADKAQPAEPLQSPDLLAALPDDWAAANSGRDLPVTPTVDPGDSGGGQTGTDQPNTADGQRGTPGGSGYTKTSVFGVEGKGNKFVYVFDRSASMEGPPLAAAKRQLIESLQSLDTVHQFQIIFFNHRLRSFDSTGGGRRIAFASDRNKKLAANFIGGITADGGTDRFAALKQALALRPDVVFFLTDADDPMSGSELADIGRLNSRIGASICVIQFGRGATPAGDNFLKQLASQSGGQYGYVNTTKLMR